MNRIATYNFLLVAVSLAIVSCHDTSSKSKKPAINSTKTEVQVLSVLTLSEEKKEFQLTFGAINDTTLKLQMGIGYYEAQELAVTIEKIKPKAPLPLDLLHDALTKFGYSVKEVQIDKLVDSVYKAKIVCQKEGETVILAARPVDATVIALKFNSPIFVKTDFLTR